MIAPSPVASECAVGRQIFPDGTSWVVLKFATAQGEQFFYFPDDRAIQIGRALLGVTRGVEVITQMPRKVRETS